MLHKLLSKTNLASGILQVEEAGSGTPKSCLKLLGFLTPIMFFSAGIAFGQSATLTPVSDIGMHTVTVDVPAKYASVFPAGKTLSVQSNYTVSVFHAGGMTKPRFMTFGPGGVLYVSDMSTGKVLALPDADNNGVADAVVEAATGFSGNHDVKFYKGSMYVTEPTRIWKCTDTDGDGVYETKVIFISNIAGNETGGHTTRTVVFDSINAKVYVSVGSSCNVCRENHRAIIEQYNDDGTGRRVFSTGTRNAVGMTLHPSTNRLWANNNGSDQQGNETPPEWIDIVRDGGFYGHPFAYGSGVWFNFAAHSDYTALLPITAADSAKVANLMQPAALIRAHSAPMALEFLDSKSSAAMKYGFLTALRGSWNTTAPNNFRGFKVIYGHLSSEADTTVDYVADFCTGFLTDTVARVYWGRPVGIAIADNGKVYISSDESNKFILVLTPKTGTGMKNVNSSGAQIGAIYPNPVKNQFTISLNLKSAAKVTATLYDISGREIKSLIAQNFSGGSHSQQIDIKNLPAGTYLVKITADNTTVTQKIIVEK
ncbi:MAG: T9SS type A sorting domain-containing protein [Chitinophagaceae bacterium]